MNKIKEKREFDASPEIIWNIVSNISRSDWVPGVESIELEGNKRIFKMTGMGRLVEEIIECDDGAFVFCDRDCDSYSTPSSKN